MKFKVLAGAHIDDNGKLYRQGEILESKKDLAALHNTPMGRKFERIFDGPQEVSQGEQTEVIPPAPPPQPTSPKVENFDSMSMKELMQRAADEEIDLKGEKSRDAVIKILKAVLSTQPVGAKG